MAETVTIPRRFCGPPASANGGYACGVVASLVGVNPAEVTLRSPPPLDVPLRVDRGEDHRVVLRSDDTVIAEGGPASGAFEIPEPVTLADAERAARPIPNHVYPTCFVCGPARAPGDGLRLFPGPLTDRPLIAAPFTPTAIDCTDGVLRPEVTWSLLDCPSGLVLCFLDNWSDLFLLGRMAARLDIPLRQDARYIAVAKIIKVEGRKGHTTSALFDEAGTLCAVARATWLKVSK